MEWHVDEYLLRKHMGRVRLAGEEPDCEQSDPDRMFESPEDGCPGGDQRCRFVRTLFAYVRRPDRQGNRVPNPRLDRCDDDLVLDAVALFEGEQDACSGFCMDEMNRKMEEKASRGT